MKEYFEPYKIYKFKPKDLAYLWCLFEYDPVEVITPYTSDIYNHSAEPHRRYVVRDIKRNIIIDVAECELDKNGMYNGICI